MDPNMTIAAAANVIPVGPISGLLKAFSALVGGVFGIYLIVLYLKYKEYVVMKRMLLDIRKDLRAIADAQEISLPPIKKPKVFRIGRWFKRAHEERKMRKELEDQND
ncbi:TPA: hypothetical protein HA265_01035 [Candidatus Woesearchaeota archaeon]|nr:hypothetical protein [Candidatus Woesearchaeota archaeon]